MENKRSLVDLIEQVGWLRITQKCPNSSYLEIQFFLKIFQVDKHIFLLGNIFSLTLCVPGERICPVLTIIFTTNCIYKVIDGSWTHFVIFLRENQVIKVTEM